MGNRLGIGIAVVLGAACGGGSKNTQTGGNTQSMGTSETGAVQVPRVDPSLCETAGKKVTTFDLDHDNQPDVWKLYKTIEEGGTTLEVLTCKQVDLDRDGRKDYVITYDTKGNKITEEFDFDFDGRFDARHYYDEKTARVYLVERDSDYDKQPDIWEKYTTEGVIESVRRDRNADGKPDVWEQFDAGILVAILWDDDFDARVDRKDEVKGSGAPAGPPPGEGTPPAEETAPPADDETGGEASGG